MTLTNLLAVFIGSGLGGMCRYLCSNYIQSFTPRAIFPWGTFAVNIIGCFIIGILYGLFDRNNICNPEMRLLLTVGFCGGFTTFSTFINENYLLFSHSSTNSLIALFYLLASVFTGFIMLYLGHRLTA